LSTATTDGNDTRARLLKVAEAADYLRVSDRKLWGLTQPRGPVRCVRIGKSVRYRLADLERYAEEMAAV
jgi:excisionase family DNA binding protein